jgi:hypothetical protein
MSGDVEASCITLCETLERSGCLIKVLKSTLPAQGGRLLDHADRSTKSVKTVESHKTHLMQQLDVHSTAALIKFTITEGLAGAESGLP